MDEQEYIVQMKRCVGVITWNGFSLCLPFDLTVTFDGTIRIDLGSHPLTNQNSWLLTAYYPKSTTMEVLTLDGKSPDGYHILSKSVHLTKAAPFSDQNGSFVTAEASASQMDIKVTEVADHPTAEWMAEFWSAGLRCFRQVEMDSEHGEICVAGASTVEDFGRICGVVRVKKCLDANTDQGAWLSLVEETVRRVQDMLSFSDGRFISTNIRQTFQNGELRQISLYGRRSVTRPYKPPFSYLNLVPVLGLAVSRYTKKLIDKTGMDVALEWHLMPHHYNEARFLAQMTALEHLVHVFSKLHSSSSIFPKTPNLFKQKIKPGIEAKLDDLQRELGSLEKLPDGFDLATAITAAKTKLDELNRQSLRTNLFAMLAKYRVPLDGLEDFIQKKNKKQDKTVPDLISIRNDIVHSGLHKFEDNEGALGQCVAAAEELLRRIFFSFLEYEGNYKTYFKTVEDRTFRRCSPAGTETSSL